MYQQKVGDMQENLIFVGDKTKRAGSVIQCTDAKTSQNATDP